MTHTEANTEKNTKARRKKLRKTKASHITTTHILKTTTASEKQAQTKTTIETPTRKATPKINEALARRAKEKQQHTKHEQTRTRKSNIILLLTC